MTTNEIINALGGRKAVSDVTGTTPNAVTQWRKAGIPPLHWHKLVATPEAQTHGITFDTLASAERVAMRTRSSQVDQAAA